MTDEQKATQKIILTGVVGLLLPDAYDFAHASGFSIRCSRIEGIPQICTRDYRTDRINVEIQLGKVQAAYIG